jgi:hypothetical protein
MLRALVKQGDGSCCTCAKQIDACNCNNSTCSIECREKSALATLCGYDEFTSPSDPPKKYRKLSQSNGYTLPFFINSDCTLSAGAPNTHCTWSGECSYDKDTCAFTSGGTQDCGGGPVSNCGVLGPDDGGRTITLTPTTKSYTPTGACFFASGGPWYGHYTDLSVMISLSDEDTEDDAISRAAAALDWAGCGCGAAPCSAFITDRTGSGSVDFGWRKVETRVLFTGLTAGHSYMATLGLARRVLGTGGPFIDFGTMEISFTVDDPTHASDWQPIPNEAGWETIVTSCVTVEE